MINIISQVYFIPVAIISQSLYSLSGFKLKYDKCQNKTVKKDSINKII